MNEENNRGRAALLFAAFNRHLDVTKYLISQGVDVNRSDNESWTALHAAAQEGHLDVTEYFMSRCKGE